MKILGIDPGLQICGYAVVEIKNNDVKLLEAGVCKTDGKKTLEKRLAQLEQDIVSIVEKYRPDIAAVEELYSHYAHPVTAILMGHARGVILNCIAKRGTEIKSFAATKIKKAITGNGRATKLQMQRSIKTLLALPEVPQPADVADAIAAALCCSENV